MSNPQLPSEEYLAVAPREVLDAVYRSLRASGADPAEADVASHVVLRSQLNGDDGFALLSQLLDGNWYQTTASRVINTRSAGISVKELVNPCQPPLRSAIQLVDLAREFSTQSSLVVCRDVSELPHATWQSVLDIQCPAPETFHIVIPKSSNPDSVVTPESLAYASALTDFGEDYVAIVRSSTDVSPSVPNTDNVDHLTIPVHVWQAIIKTSQRYLVQD